MASMILHSTQPGIHENVIYWSGNDGPGILAGGYSSYPAENLSNGGWGKWSTGSWPPGSSVGASTNYPCYDNDFWQYWQVQDTTAGPIAFAGLEINWLNELATNFDHFYESMMDFYNMMAPNNDLQPGAQGLADLYFDTSNPNQMQSLVWSLVHNLWRSNIRRYAWDDLAGAWRLDGGILCNLALTGYVASTEFNATHGPDWNNWEKEIIYEGSNSEQYCFTPGYIYEFVVPSFYNPGNPFYNHPFDADHFGTNGLANLDMDAKPWFGATYAINGTNPGDGNTDPPQLPTNEWGFYLEDCDIEGIFTHLSNTGDNIIGSMNPGGSFSNDAAYMAAAAAAGNAWSIQEGTHPVTGATYYSYGSGDGLTILDVQQMINLKQMMISGLGGNIEKIDAVIAWMQQVSNGSLPMPPSHPNSSDYIGIDPTTGGLDSSQQQIGGGQMLMGRYNIFPFFEIDIDAYLQNGWQGPPEPVDFFWDNPALPFTNPGGPAPQHQDIFVGLGIMTPSQWFSYFGPHNSDGNSGTNVQWAELGWTPPTGYSAENPFEVYSQMLYTQTINPWEASNFEIWADSAFTIFGQGPPWLGNQQTGTGGQGMQNQMNQTVDNEHYNMGYTLQPGPNIVVYTKSSITDIQNWDTILPQMIYRMDSWGTGFGEMGHEGTLQNHLTLDAAGNIVPWDWSDWADYNSDWIIAGTALPPEYGGDPGGVGFFDEYPVSDPPVDPFEGHAGYAFKGPDGSWINTSSLTQTQYDSSWFEEYSLLPNNMMYTGMGIGPGGEYSPYDQWLDIGISGTSLTKLVPGRTYIVWVLPGTQSFNTMAFGDSIQQMDSLTFQPNTSIQDMVDILHQAGYTTYESLDVTGNGTIQPSDGILIAQNSIGQNMGDALQDLRPLQFIEACYSLNMTWAFEVYFPPAAGFPYPGAPNQALPPTYNDTVEITQTPVGSVKDITDEEKVTISTVKETPYFGDGTQQLSGNEIHTMSMAESNHPYFYTITKGDPNEPGAEPVFDVSFGSRHGSGSFSGDPTGSIIPAAKAVYWQWFNLGNDVNEMKNQWISTMPTEVAEHYGIDTSTGNIPNIDPYTGDNISSDGKNQWQNEWGWRITSGSNLHSNFYLNMGGEQATNYRVDNFIYVLQSKKKKQKEEIATGWTIKLKGKKQSPGLAGGLDNNLYLTDDANYEDYQMTPLGPRHRIISGSTGLAADATDVNTYGYFYPQAGAWVFGENVARELGGGILGYGASKTQGNIISHSVAKFNDSADIHNILYPVGCRRRVDELGTNVLGGLQGTGSIADQDYKNALRFVNVMKNAEGPGSQQFAIRGLKIKETKTVHTYLCRVLSDEHNFTSNPTRLSGSYGEFEDGIIDNNTNSSGSSTTEGDPYTYITGVQLYGPNGNMIATGKLSQPLYKNFSREAIIKVQISI